VVVTPASGSWLNNPDNSFEVRLATELGFVGVLAHTIQLGQQGTKFDYVADGGQDVLFPFRRMSAELHLKPRHTIILLYQPLDVRTETYLVNPLVLDSDTFPAGTPMNLRYGFGMRLSRLSPRTGATHACTMTSGRCRSSVSGAACR
jgi:hypothetical protein